MRISNSPWSYFMVSTSVGRPTSSIQSTSSQQKSILPWDLTYTRFYAPRTGWNMRAVPPFTASHARRSLPKLSGHTRRVRGSIRIDMLGDGGRRYVTQAAWIRSLLSTFVKKWESTRVPIGGLYGAPAGADQAVLPWTRSQQAAFLVAAWSHIRDAIGETTEPWATELREEYPDADGDVAFTGFTTLPNTDQGVRAILSVLNDLSFVRADSLGLRDWPPSDFTEGTSEIGLRESLKSLSNLPLNAFLKSIAKALASYDWRTYGAPGLPDLLRSSKARFRGSTGYRELRQDVLSHLAAGSDEEIASASSEVLLMLGLDRR